MRGFTTRLLAGCIALGISGAAQASITISTTPGTDPYSGPAPTYDFETAGTTPIFSGGAIESGSSSGLWAQPFGSTGNYYSVGPSTSTPGLIDLTMYGAIGTISFIWGSVDAYNTLNILDVGYNIIGTFSGSAVYNPANGDQANPLTNPLVTLTFTGNDRTNAGYLQLLSTQNAFETDNYTVSAVPEPATWALLIIGFGAVGSQIRRRRNSLAVSYA